MKANQLDILMVPGYQGSDENHWQSRWERKLTTARRVEQDAWSKPVRSEWIARLREEVEKSERPVLLVGHSLGVATIVQAVPLLGKRVKGAFLVAAPDVANPNIRPKHLMTFGPYPTEKLPFPSVLIASRNDEYCEFSVAEKLGEDWGSLFLDAGEAGHINTKSGHGPWPEGLMVFTQFIGNLS
ncbi:MULTISPECIES: RBBP9/YdeN family alpha/beta hydrolase [unclassified Bartonella]|uniref:RBBP9/YdeN family alpha/beta hydrolase n=1 Tax=unclassified Bartonella TaxID=2645622 RepID=UPI0015FD7BEB|nr:MULTISPECIES: alpha/beta hydrolase [unclassified Bartonella]UXM96243.1 alpha/beta hydrolase [Bartonella sp. HY329]UXN02310.1 alpha/beta hydrolase [Bartonella sp. HY406]UXN05206.1 alpha/beta hydrolase [Bartonella sp. HY761]UXN10567.1 alpha/beta hydrolase [Bartonella sp. HY328]